MSLIQNERLKLTANWLNGLATGVVVTGAVAPVVAALYGVAGPSEAGYFELALLGVAWLVAGFALLLVASKLLGRLQQ